ncbi:hypothetical protein [Microbacterium laevaniformans]|uniref:hypothetical protein n=1 Tax=Microbacterium laevaniformans TaxID=36807 RepID=UPI0031ECBEDA
MPRAIRRTIAMPKIEQRQQHDDHGSRIGMNAPSSCERPNTSFVAQQRRRQVAREHDRRRTP